MRIAPVHAPAHRMQHMKMPAPSGHGASPVHKVAMTMSMGKWTDHKIHALTSNADFQVRAGESVSLTITNTDPDMTHSFTAPALGIDVKLPPARDGKPFVKTVTFTAPKAGKLEWHCSVPCDPKAMATDGMMRGTITVTA